MAALICHDRGLRTLCKAVGDTHIAVAAEDEPAFRRGLSALGYALPIH